MENSQTKYGVRYTVALNYTSFHFNIFYLEWYFLLKCKRWASAHSIYIKKCELMLTTTAKLGHRNAWNLCIDLSNRTNRWNAFISIYLLHTIKPIELNPNIRPRICWILKMYSMHPQNSIHIIILKENAIPIKTPSTKIFKFKIFEILCHSIWLNTLILVVRLH